MPKAKTVADTLTAARALLAVWILWLSISGGRGAVGAVSMTLVLAWITDLLDGPIARSAPQRTHTWIGDHDLEVDLMVATSVWLYLAVSGYIQIAAAAAYAVAVALALWHFRSRHLAWGVQAPSYGCTILEALRYAPAYGVAMIAWIVGVVVVTWPRFPKETVPEFIEGMRGLFGK